VALLRPDEGDREVLVLDVLETASDVAGCELISPLEVVAAITRSLPARHRGRAEERWRDLWSRMVPVAVDAALYEAALGCLRAHRLRSLDAIHLAAALRIGCSRLVTFDTELGAAARKAGIEVFGV
jgi:predicted nucleic acid-binding protein